MLTIARLVSIAFGLLVILGYSTQSVWAQGPSSGYLLPPGSFPFFNGFLEDTNGGGPDSGDVFAVAVSTSSPNPNLLISFSSQWNGSIPEMNELLFDMPNGNGQFTRASRQFLKFDPTGAGTCGLTFSHSATVTQTDQAAQQFFCNFRAGCGTGASSFWLFGSRKHWPVSRSL